MKEEEIRNRSAHSRYLELVAEDVQQIFKDNSQFVKINCPACGGKKYQPQFEKTGFTLALCPNCGTLFINPRPPSHLLNDFYTRSQSASFFVHGFFQPVAEARRIKIFRPRAEYIRDALPDKSQGIIGDIGAGVGIFLEELARFWPAARMVAIEPSLEEVAICKEKRLETIPCALEEVEGWDGKFDLMTSFELFEHLYSPDEFLKKIYSLLRPGGYLFLTTQNGEGFDIQILWEKSRSICPPVHLNFFNPGSMKKLLEANHFIVEQIDTPGKLDWDIVEGMYQEKAIEKERFWKLLADKGGAATKTSLQTWITENGLSSHMRVLARKK
jgi:SAM-dependent methyltransferase